MGRRGNERAWRELKQYVVKILNELNKRENRQNSKTKKCRGTK